MRRSPCLIAAQKAGPAMRTIRCYECSPAHTLVPCCVWQACVHHLCKRGSRELALRQARVFSACLSSMLYSLLVSQHRENTSWPAVFEAKTKHTPSALGASMYNDVGRGEARKQICTHMKFGNLSRHTHSRRSH